MFGVERTVDVGRWQIRFRHPLHFSNMEFTDLSSTTQAVDWEALQSGSLAYLIRQFNAIVGLVSM